MHRPVLPQSLGFFARSHRPGLSLLLATLIGCGADQPQKSDFTFPPELRQYPVNTGDPTLNLWNAVNSQLLLLRANCPPDTDAGKARRAMIGDVYFDAIMRTSMKNADPELVEWTVLVLN